MDDNSQSIIPQALESEATRPEQPIFAAPPAAPAPPPVNQLSLSEQIVLLRRALRVAIFAYMEMYDGDIFRVFTKEELSKMLGEVEDQKDRRVEDIYREAFDKTSTS